MLGKRFTRIVSLVLAALLFILPLGGCTSKINATNSSSIQNATKKSSEFELKRVQFHDITIMVPDTLTDGSSGNEDQLDFYLPESAKDPFAFSMHVFFNDGINYTARDAYENMAEFEDDARLIEVDGLEFLVEQENHGNSSTTSILLTLDGSGYAIYVDYKEDTNQAYKSYVNDICQYISVTAASQSGNVPSIPAGAISWQEAQSHIGENVTVCGPVVGTNYAKKVNGQPTYLDIGAAYPDTSGVSALIWGEDRSAFEHAPESTYEGQTICVTGEPYMYNGQCYIKVTSPSQIQVL